MSDKFTGHDYEAVAAALSAASNRKKEEEEAAKVAQPEDHKDGDAVTAAKLCLELPLYTEIETTDRILIRRLKTGLVQFDTYCVGCDQRSTFKTERAPENVASTKSIGVRRPGDIDVTLMPGFFEVQLFCARNRLHSYKYAFRYWNGKLSKYGQLPSLEDIAGGDIQKFRHVLPNGYFSELKRATGLASHGIGIGSFVYLRRIFERLIADHRDASQIDLPDDFDSKRMDEKIALLKDDLPPALVENKATYGILSKGIHELDEETCRKFFPVVRQAIILILEQDYRRKKEAEEAKKLRNSIAAMSGELSKGKAK